MWYSLVRRSAYHYSSVSCRITSPQLCPIPKSALGSQLSTTRYTNPRCKFTDSTRRVLAHTDITSSLGEIVGSHPGRMNKKVVRKPMPPGWRADALRAGACVMWKRGLTNGDCSRVRLQRLRTAGVSVPYPYSPFFPESAHANPFVSTIDARENSCEREDSRKSIVLHTPVHMSWIFKLSDVVKFFIGFFGTFFENLQILQVSSVTIGVRRLTNADGLFVAAGAEDGCWQVS